MAVRREDFYERDAVVYRFPAAASRGRLRRYRLRRTALGIVLVGAIGGVMGSGGEAPGSRPGAPRAVVVRSGETLWALAGRYAERGADPRSYVDELMRLNHLRSSPEAGMRLRLPR